VSRSTRERPAVWPAPATWRRWAAQAAVGAVLGLLLTASVVLVAWAAGWLRVVGVAPPGAAVLALLSGLGRAVLVAVVEETLFRGVLVGYLRARIGLPAAVGLSALAFGAAHAFNAHVTPLALANLVAAGLLFALAFVVGRGLALPIGLHAAWNWFEGSVFGLPVSGVPRDRLLVVEEHGPPLWTGGAFGPEGGLLGLAAMALVAGVLWLARDHLPQEPPAAAA
jgi:membrane protease YdiL (CAAX protease family)